MPRLALLAAALLLLTGCQTTARYEPKGGPGSYGYSSMSVSARRFRVAFEGDPATDISQVRDFALLRAAELTREAGGTHFRVVAERNRINSNVQGVTHPVSSRGAHSDSEAPPRDSVLYVHREYPVAWLEFEIYTAAQPANPGETGVRDAAETQADIRKRYRLNP